VSDTSRSNDHANLATTLIRSGWLIALAVGLFAAAAFWLSIRSRPSYEARTTIRLNPSGETGMAAMLQPQALSGRIVLMDDELEVLRSRSLAEAVLDRARRGNGNLSFLEGLDDEHAPEALLAAVNVTPIRKSQLIELKIRAPRASEARDLVNLYAAIYQERNRQETRSEIRKTKEFLQEQVDLVMRRLELTEDALKDYRTSMRVADLREDTESTVSKMAEFRADYNRVRADLQAGEDRLRYLRDRLAERRATLVVDVQNVDDGLVESMRQDLGRLEGARSRLLAQGLSPDHEKMREVEAQTRRIRERLEAAANAAAGNQGTYGDPVGESQALAKEITALEGDVLTLRSRSEALARVVGGYDKDLRELPTVALQLARLERNRAADEKILAMLAERLEEARIREAGLLGQVTIVDPATVPLDPVSPRPLRDTVMGLLAGLLVGVALALTRSRLDDRLENLEEMERFLGAKPLGVLPRIQPQGEGPTRGRLLLTDNGWLPAYESYRKVWTNLRFAVVDEGCRTLCVTSPIPSEGKSLTSVNLALVASARESRVLLVDADLRRPNLHRLLGLSNSCGLTDVLMGSVPLETALTRTRFGGLDLLCSGPLPSNPGDLLGSQAMAKLVERLRGMYDIVIIDTPPVIPFSDAIEIGRRVEGIVLVARMGVTGRRLLRAAMDTISGSSTRVLGVIANDYKRAGKRGLLTRGYDYHYANPEYDSKPKKRAA
jgi:capsular exopolysaccharide synthesis family protein